MTSPRPNVSVVLPTWNRRATLSRALASAFAEPETLEVIVVDDGSTDGTLEALASRAEPRLQVIAREHTGNVAALRNLAASAARGEWLAFLDSDDRWERGKLSRQLAAAGESGADWSFTGGRFVDEEDRALSKPYAYPVSTTGPDLLSDLLAGRVGAAMPSLVVRTELFHALGGCDTTLFHDDIELMLRLAARGPAAIVPDAFVVITKDSRRPTGPAESLRHHREMLAVMAATGERARDGAIRRLVHGRSAFHLRQIAHAERLLGRVAGAAAARAHALLHEIAARFGPARVLPCPCAPRRA
jgi:GT2 family glycosyltransferase